MDRPATPHCRRCGRPPEKIEEYINAGEGSDMTPTEYVLQEEGTYNPRNDRFWCTSCYVRVGCPEGLA